MRLADFVAKHPPKEPAKPPDNDDELRKLVESDGVRWITDAPAKNPVGTGRPESSASVGCHLWVFDAGGIPHILERAPVSPPLQSGKAKHTNLTGGAPASCGGEMWFETEASTRIYVNGASGRYGPTSAEQLEDAIRVFSALGYDVVSFGFDQDAGRAHRVLR